MAGGRFNQWRHWCIKPKKVEGRFCGKSVVFRREKMYNPKNYICTHCGQSFTKAEMIIHGVLK